MGTEEPSGYPRPEAGGIQLGDASVGLIQACHAAKLLQGGWVSYLTGHPRDEVLS